LNKRERDREALARYEAAVLAARGRALEAGCARAELFEAVMADPEVIAATHEPAVRDAIVTLEAKRLLATEPDLLRAAENGYSGAKDRLFSKLEMKLRMKELKWQRLEC
jgi:hypothetical protein